MFKSLLFPTNLIVLVHFKKWFKNKLHYWYRWYFFSFQNVSALFSISFLFHQKLYNTDNTSFYTKDAFHRYVIDCKTDAVNPLKKGTKMAAHYVLTVPSGGQHIIRCRLSACDDKVPLPFNEKDFDEVVTWRKNEADEFYKTVIPGKRFVYVILFYPNSL